MTYIIIGILLWPVFSLSVLLSDVSPDDPRSWKDDDYFFSALVGGVSSLFWPIFLLCALIFFILKYGVKHFYERHD